MRRFMIILATLLTWLAGITTPAVAAPGDLDTTFGEDGVAFASDGTVALALAADGSLVSSNVWSIERRTPDGALDPSFGDGGVIVPTQDWIWDVAIQPDGRIVAVGELDDDIYVTRFLADGSPDRSFSGDGQIVKDLGGYDAAYGVAIDRFGRILVAGQGGIGSAFLARYGPRGMPDRTFDDNGILAAPVRNGLFRDVFPGPAGGMLAIGGANGRYLLARYGPDGRLTRSYGDGGIATVGRDVGVRDGERLQDGSAILTGACFTDRWHLCIAKFGPTGAPDDGFGDGGRILADLPSTIGTSGGDSAIDGSGKIVTVGENLSTGKLLVFRFEADGSADATFSGDGVARGTELGIGVGGGRAVVIQLDGRIVVGGWFSSDPGGFLTRLLG